MSYENQICLPECYKKRESATLAAIGKMLTETAADIMVSNSNINADLTLDRVGCIGVIASFACRMCLADGNVNTRELAYLSMLYDEIEDLSDVEEFSEICDDETIETLDALTDESPELTRAIIRVCAIAAAIDGSYDVDVVTGEVYMSEPESNFMYKLLSAVSD